MKLERLKYLAGIITESGYRADASGGGGAITLDKDDGEVNDDAVDKLFSKVVSVSDEDLEKWEQAGFDVIHLDDQMGNDSIYDVNGTFILWDRHAGNARVAPKGTTKESILAAIQIEKDVGPQ